MMRGFIDWNRRASAVFDGMRSEKWRTDGLQDYTNDFLPAYIHDSTTICDIGGGKRPYIAAATKKQRNIKIIGLDISAEELARAPKGSYDKTYRADIGNFKALSDVADTIICQALLEHVKNNDAAIRAIAQILKTGGEAVLFIPCRNAAFARLNLWMPEKLKRRLLFKLFPETEHAQGFPAFYDHCTPKAIRALAKKHGLRVSEERFYYFSNYFTFLLPLHLIWRAGQCVAYALVREQAAEAFSVTLRK